ncbi:TPA: hypothetical protein ACQJHO_000806 [Enterococcus faecium]|jgi:hypothetical protein
MRKEIGKNELQLSVILLLQAEFSNLIQSNEDEKEFIFDTKYKNIRKALKVGEKYNSKPDLFNYPINVEDYLAFSAELHEYYTFIKRVERLIK